MRAWEDICERVAVAGASGPDERECVTEEEHKLKLAKTAADFPDFLKKLYFEVFPSLLPRRGYDVHSRHIKQGILYHRWVRLVRSIPNRW